MSMQHDSPALRLDDQLCFALYAATNAVTRAYRPLLQRLGLTYPQYLVMLVLWQDGESPVGAIAARLSLPHNALVPMIDRLEGAGFVSRRRDDGDRRRTLIRLTDEGRRLEADAAAAQAQVVCETGLQPEALSALRDELKALLSRMNAAEGPAGLSTNYERDQPQ
ncbi:MarR family winged helix-turn-helix transcriptional regulator [Tranquillimonas rosea]|uniref:MarR family winged helix-turn-helix transcriptional regulator n=1 Tax=Tranquillimonas rosea TaxID=641238 RepID=UPI003BA917CB